VSSVGHAMCHGAKLALPLVTIKVAADEFGVDLDRMGWAIMAFLIGMAVSAVPSGLAGDRYGTERVLVVFFGLLSAAAAGCGMAETYTHFAVAHGLLGVAAGLFHPAALGLISLSVESDKLGEAMGRFGMMGSAGMIAVPFLMNSSLGWRAGYFGLAVGALVMMVVSLALIRMGLLRDHRQQPNAAESSAAQAPDTQSAGGLSIAMLLLLSAMGVNAFLGAGWETIFPETINDVGLVVLSNQTIAAGILVVGGIGQYVGGVLARDAYAASRYAIIMVVQCLVLLGTATAIDRSAMPFMLLGSFAFFNTMTMPMENRMLAGFTSTRRRATAFAMKFLVSLLIAAPAPWIVAEFYQGATDSQSVYRFLSLAGMLGVLAGYFYLRATRRTAARARVR
jgi:MFS family permease